MDYLSTLLSVTDHNLKYYIEYTVPSRIRDQDRDLVFRNLYEFPELLKSVKNRPQWETAVWPMVIRGLKNEKYLPDSWMQMVVNKDRPDGNKALLTHFEHRGSNYILKYVKRTSIPEADIKKSVRKMWRVKKSGDSYDIDYPALCAVQYGEFDALKHLVMIIKSPNNNDSHSVKQARSILLRMVDTNDDIVAWYEQNRNRIRFDERTEKYVVR